MNSQVLGERYKVQQQLGKKAGRRTLLARDLLTSELVVIKLLSFNSDFEWDDLKLFEREAETLKSLSYPFIPGYLDYFQVNLSTFKGFALVQTHIPAPTLEQYLKSGRTFSEVELKQIAKALLDILIYLHRRQPPVIHRDIKPSNILLSNRSGNSVGQLYLIDFGSVQTACAAHDGSITVVGTYGYMPPEQFGGRTVAGSDLYSLGSTLIYLACGIHPADLPQKDFRIQFEHAVNLSPTFSSWLKWMTEPTLEERFSSACQALAALEQSYQIFPTRWVRGAWYWNGKTWFSKQQPQLIRESKYKHSYKLTHKVSQPVGSKIRLTRDNDFLEIVIPPVGYQRSMTFLVLFAIAWNSFTLFWTINALAAPLPANIFLALFSLPFWAAGCQMVTWVLSSWLKSTRLHLSKEEITFTWELLGLKFNLVPPALKKDISNLVYCKRTFTTDSEGNKVEVPPQLIIWAGVHKYQIGGSNGLIQSEPELEWLASELSDWLGLPIGE
ncbi:serine/threonine protein kinase [Aetokthonos hydrillicola Thurmond2011]|jgi:serine/threonine protein kinase|uniref:Serine/threonine protein kinase n=1 Tax=Aetokthonos hydrillicola Thurmond2011 TaxID=2712845 RepID=A0AAP5I4F3_9CYAN|nr:serine/threonine-protein kinase [Aetokthonos hydrillicola]MBO3460863.1 serine/threonine protein kinase [Aetokthonos hydrillicola CCALA 1050]MBW4585656.1 serine/threonine protein kinase [Aetokthonos hydrillicola CCALA 1050]MDR9894556.1 serine/threonine protein kinase [Aetokthonos hydrillicola Thurmond2011]